MLDILFYVFSAITLIAALLMVITPNAVNGAMCMIVAFIGTAALFVLLEAYFLAVIQVVVYAGAVMVLFLFIIMLLDVDKGEGATEYNNKLTIGASAIGFLLLVMLVFTAFSGDHLPELGLTAVTEILRCSMVVCHLPHPPSLLATASLLNTCCHSKWLDSFFLPL